ncbi:hypothetical protein IX39_19715 [Chryseobacterium formosense]|uniref:Uncharacterized protein n=1 Tax=Chryseobacterium formosense TaxID=236814 RepID=A0A085YZ97_9FLAO|nr:hypothetical protein [Chryseobacterium formosense]KFE97510.1 hypothetical protein IX39_19715 [Chryseobacterium formosense]SFT75470.1 hypothetical protein SAMN05421857_3049 [Chryseobacterium formosense]
MKNSGLIRKLQSLIEKNLYLSKSQIRGKFGQANGYCDNHIWFFKEPSYIRILKNEIGFIFEEDIVVDIFIAQYFLGREFRNVFYYEYKDPKYKVYNFLY